jgi:hypothetical protein
MRRRTGFAALVASAALAGGLVAMAAAPAGAAPGDTPTTFSITAGALSITVPASANLGSVNTGASSVSGSLGNVTVTDQRGGLTPLWTSNVTSTDFTTGGASANETVVKANVNYASGLASSSGLGAFVPQLGVALGSAQRAANWVGIAGNNSSTWNPTLTLSLASSQVAGGYSGTINHSVL